MSKRKTLRRTGWWLLAASWLIYLLLSDRIAIVLLRDSYDAVPLRYQSAALESAGNRVEIEKIQTYELSPLDKTEVGGWIELPASDQRAGRSKVRLLLQGHRSSYAVDVSEVEGKKAIRQVLTPEAQLRFTTIFIPIRLRYDIYRLGVLIEHDNAEPVVVWTGKTFVQDRRGWRAAD